MLDVALFSRRGVSAAVVAGVLFANVAASAQQPASPTAPPAPANAPKGLTPEQIEGQKRQIEHINQMNQDWPFLKRFHDEDAALPAPSAGEGRVVFMGDSITEAWMHNGEENGAPGPAFFPGKPYVNRGISGQTTPQMLVRFRQDVVALKPKAVVIFAGTNDVAGNTGEMTAQATEDNISSMADIAHSNGIKVVLCSILPAFDFPWRRGREPGPKIVALNTWIKGYAAEHGYVYVDFYSAMVDSRGGLPPNLSKDGVHPLKAGYDIMNPLVEAGIAKAIGQ
jgi:lysophospholipase L1-like esterase